jgi:hypothetical protein
MSLKEKCFHFILSANECDQLALVFGRRNNLFCFDFIVLVLASFHFF